MSILSRLSLVFNSSIFALPDEELLQEHAVLDLDSHLETLLVCVLANDKTLNDDDENESLDLLQW